MQKFNSILNLFFKKICLTKATSHYVIFLYLSKIINKYYLVKLDPHLYYKINVLRFFIMLVYILLIIFFNLTMYCDFLHMLIENYLICNDFIFIGSSDEPSSELPNNIGGSTQEGGPSPDPEGSPMSLIHPSDSDYESSTSESDESSEDEPSYE